MATRPQNNPQVGESARHILTLAAGLFTLRVGPTARMERTPESVADDCLALAEMFYRRADARLSEAPQTEKGTTT